MVVFVLVAWSTLTDRIVVYTLRASVVSHVDENQTSFLPLRLSFFPRQQQHLSNLCKYHRETNASIFYRFLSLFFSLM